MSEVVVSNPCKGLVEQKLTPSRARRTMEKPLQGSVGGHNAPQPRPGTEQQG